MYDIWYKKRHFYVEDGTGRHDTKHSGLEKSEVNEIVAANREWTDVLDAFAGYGISSYIFSKHAKRVLALEKRERTFSILWQNISDIENIEAVHTDNLSFLEKAVKEEIEPPDLIDLDPFGNPYAQLRHVLAWMKKGALLVTTGEIEGIYRNSFIVRKNYPELKGKYIGKEAVWWAEREFIPRVIKQYPDSQLNPVHFYAEPSSVRVVFEVGGFEFTKETKDKLAARPHYLSWFKEAADLLRGREQ